MQASIETILASYNDRAPLAEASTIPAPWYVDPRIAELERALPELLVAPMLGFDTEGTGLDPLTARVRLVPSRPAAAPAPWPGPVSPPA